MVLTQLDLPISNGIRLKWCFLHVVLTQLDLPIANEIRIKGMTPSRLDCHFFKDAYLIGLNHIIFLCRLDRT